MKRNKELDFPTEWEEVSPVEWVEALRLHQMMVRGECSMKEAKVMWVRFVLAARGLRTARVGDAVYMLIYNISQQLDWMWSEVDTDDGPMVELHFDSTFNPLPKWRSLVGPLSHGADLDFGEWRRCVVLMNACAGGENEDALAALAGSLYRRSGGNPSSKRWSGRYRVPFDEARIGQYTDAVKKMPDYVKWGIYRWFVAFNRYLMEGDFIVDGMTVNFGSIFGRRKDDDGPADKSLGLTDIGLTVAESGVYGSLEEVDRTPLFKILMKLLSDGYKAEAIKKRMKQ